MKSTHVRGYGDGLRCLLISLPSAIGLHFTVKRLARTHTHTGAKPCPPLLTSLSAIDPRSVSL